VAPIVLFVVAWLLVTTCATVTASVSPSGERMLENAGVGTRLELSADLAGDHRPRISTRCCGERAEGFFLAPKHVYPEKTSESHLRRLSR
jgi:hypothetical protein